MAKAAELDTELVAGLKAAKSKRAHFALVLKGSNDGALIVSKTKVPPADIATAKKQSGGSAILKGFCQYEDGKYIFETAKEAPATAPQAVKTIVKRDAGMAVHAEFRVGADPELLADEGDPSAASLQTAQSAGDGAELTKRLNALTPDIKAALAGPNKARVQALFVAVSGQIKNQDFVPAGQGLDELEKLVSQAGAAQSPLSPAALQAAALKRLNAMSAEIKAALAANGPQAARIKSLFVAANGLLKNQDFVGANKVLDELEPLLEPGAAADDGAAVKQRLATLKAQVVGLKTSDPAGARSLAGLLIQADSLAQANDFAGATLRLDEVERRLGAAQTATKAAPTAEGATAAAAARWIGARQRWGAADAAVDAQIGALQSALRQIGDPVMKQIAEFGMNGLTGDNKVKLMASLIELGDGAPSAMSKAGPKALEIVRAFRQHLETDEKIDVCDDNPLDVPVSIRATLGGALAEMQEALEAALAAQPAAA